MDRKIKGKIALGLIVVGVLLILFVYFEPYLLSPADFGSYYALELSFVVAAGVCLVLSLLIFADLLMSEGRMKRATWWMLQGALASIIIGGVGTISINLAVMDYQQNVNATASFVAQVLTIAAPLVAILAGGIMLFTLAGAKTGQE